MSAGILYLIIGEMGNKRIIGSYQNGRVPHEIVEKSKTIFNGVKNFEKKGKLNFNSNIYYSSIIKNNIFLLAVVPYDQDERVIYSLFEDIDNQGVYKNIDSKTGDLNNVGRQNLQILVDKYQEHLTAAGSDKISRVNSEINDIHVEVKDGIKKMIHNSEIVRGLDIKADRIKDSSLIFKRDSVNLNRALWWRNMRTKIFFICLFIAIFGYIIYLIFF
jgi:hypothetical protein